MFQLVEDAQTYMKTISYKHICYNYAVLVDNM